MTTDATGQASFAIPFTAPAGLPVITATATDPNGNTSEVTSLAPGRTRSSPAQVIRLAPGQPVTFSASSGDGIALQDPDAGPLDPDVGDRALGPHRDADAGDHRGPDRLGRWDGIVIVQRPARRR